MFTTAIIAFREFLEAFLIVGVFLGVSRKLQLKKGLEIGLAAGIGVILSLALSTGVYLFGDRARDILTEKNADFLESYLLIFSGIFIAYVVFSLHKTMNKHRGEHLMQAKEKMLINSFDISLFFTIVFLVLREGFEVALFTASTSLFSVFIQNFLGLMCGFAAATTIGITTFFAYVKFPVSKVFKATEYMIILLGASLVQTGITTLFETHFNISLSNMLSFHLQFLPDEDTFVGHLLQGFFGIDQGFSGIRLAIMGIYISIIYFIFLKQKQMQIVKTSTE
ncbi:MAG TPA: FTR1 family protein [Candidatus Saccharimonadales bacterium]|nr:FTR1 family protein [Candidatus Saccharimonadales bacterium]